ncbi:MAG: radical SAM protein [Lachnospiraceae bacterium]|nr:radical SAM protein [Lachnospiraceae bacterium]
MGFDPGQQETVFPALDACRLCPRACGARRNEGAAGVCRESAAVTVGRAALHFWEEPCLSGTQGSGAVFFAGCSLGCVYCQNRELSAGRAGVPVKPERLAEIFLELEQQGAANINLVTGDHFAPQIAWALREARRRGLSVPAVWNCSGYQAMACLEILDGLIDVYLTDFKYMRPETAARYSHAPDYPETAKKALAEMVRQQPVPVFDDAGMMRRGVIVRHLLLPGHVHEAKEAVRWVHETFGDSVYLSLMNQYTPMGGQAAPGSAPGGEPGMAGTLYERYPELARRVTRREYDSLVRYALDIGVENGFLQEGETAEESFIPAFDGEGVIKERV